MRELATRSDALPLSNQSTYRGYAGKKVRARVRRAARADGPEGAGEEGGRGEGAVG